jgi:hypothetical protein
MHKFQSDSKESLLPISPKIPRFLSDYTPMLKRRYLYASCASLTAISLFGLLFFTLWAEQPTNNPVIDELPQLNSSIVPAIDLLGPQSNLLGAPTPRFRGLFYPF